MLRRLTPPAASAVPLAEFADHLRLACGFGEDGDPGSAEDPALPRCLDAAISAIEQSLSTALIRQSVRVETLRWASADRHPLPLAPALTIDAVATRDWNGVETPWPDENWTLGWCGARPALVARHGALPTLSASASITFQAGYGDDWNAVPADLRHAVLLLGAHYYERRSAADLRLDALPFGVRDLLAPYQSVRI